jgi:hypothetical protein
MVKGFDRFDALLAAMAPPIARKTPSIDQASQMEQSACSSDIQTPPDTSEGDANSHECESR